MGSESMLERGLRGCEARQATVARPAAYRCQSRRHVGREPARSRQAARAPAAPHNCKLRTLSQRARRCCGGEGRKCHPASDAGRHRRAEVDFGGTYGFGPEQSPCRSIERSFVSADHEHGWRANTVASVDQKPIALVDSAGTLSLVARSSPMSGINPQDRHRQSPSTKSLLGVRRSSNHNCQMGIAIECRSRLKRVPGFAEGDSPHSRPE